MEGKRDQHTEPVSAAGQTSRETAPLTDHRTIAMDRASRPVTFPYAIGDPILPGYRLVKPLGKGGFGEVWQADAPGGMSVAIKVLTNVGRREGTREYRALQTIKNIRHAHMVPVFGVWLKSSDGTCLGEADLAEASRRILGGNAPGKDAPDQAPLELIVAMGLGDETLHDRLQAAQRAGAKGLPSEELLDWMRQAALALDHFNAGARTAAGGAAAVQHCDIKPQNMLLVGDVVQVCDFGLARSQGEVRATSNNMASLAYAPPEMVTPPYDPSPNTDQYALAISYCELRTGRLPYRDTTVVGVLNEKLSGQLDLTAVSAAEGKVLARGLDREPAKRWPSCSAFVRALAAAVGPLPESEQGPATPSTVSETVMETDRTQGNTTTASIPALSSDGDGAGRPSRPHWTWAVPLAAGATLVAVLAWAMFGGAAGRPDDPREQAAGGASGKGGAASTATKGDEGGAGPIASDARTRGAALEKAGDFVAAARAYAEVPGIKPDELARILWDLQNDAIEAGHVEDCIPILGRLEAMYGGEATPRIPGISRWDVVNSLAWYLATLPEGSDAQQARTLAEEGLKLAGEDRLQRAQSLDTLAAALARDGDLAGAVSRIEEAVTLAPTPQMAGEFEKHLEAYRSGIPWTTP